MRIWFLDLKKIYGESLKMYIELLGIPGSGKTTIYNELCNKYKDKGYDVIDYDRSIYLEANKYNYEGLLGGIYRLITYVCGEKKVKYNPLYYSIQNKYMFEFILKQSDLIYYIVNTMKTRGIDDFDSIRVLEWFSKLQCQHSIFHNYQSSENGVLILPEGFTQLTLSLFVYGTGEVTVEDINKYLNLIPKPDMIFYIEAMPKTCYRRIKIRGFPRRMVRMKLGEKQAIEFLKACDDYVQLILDYYSRIGIKVIQINNNGSIQQLRRDLSNNLIRP